MFRRHYCLILPEERIENPAPLRYLTRRVNRISFPEERIEHPALLTSTAFPFYSKTGLKIQTSFASWHGYSIWFFPEEWIAKFNLSHGNRHDYDYDYAAASLFPKSRLNVQLLVIWHASSTAFSFFTRREDWKSRLFSASWHEYSISFFPEEWIENSALLLPLITVTVFSFVQRADWKSSYTSFFTLRYCGQVLFPQSGLTSCH